MVVGGLIEGKAFIYSILAEGKERLVCLQSFRRK